MHRLLKRQLKKHKISDTCREEMKVLFEHISEAYDDFQKDYTRIETILETSSNELFKANQKLQVLVEDKSIEVDKTKKQLHKIINNVKNVIFQTNLDGKFIYLNSAWEELTGYTIEESLGIYYKKFLDKLDPNDLQAIDQYYTKEQRFKRIFTITRKDGSERFIECTFKISLDENGQPNGTIGSLVDVDQLKKTEKELIISREKEAAANATKSRFLSAMSHEIRTPLNSIIGLTDIMLIDEYLDTQSENLSALKYSSEHLLSLVNDILDFNKIAADKVHIQCKDFSLDYLMNGLSKNFNPTAEAKGIRLVIRKENNLPRVIMGDQTRLTQILTNLIGNAIKFTAEGRVEVNIEKVKEDATTIKIFFEIKDSGIGIEKENISRILQPFQQENNNIDKQYGGTGLGLPISNKLIQLMDSELVIESQKGVGSSFSFDIQFEKSEKFEQDNSRVMTDVQSSFEGLEDKLILVADDYHMNIMVLKQFLTKWGINYMIANNGKEALDLMEDNDFELVLMDLQMPVMDGYTATTAIRGSKKPYAEIPIIALTASAEPEIREKAISAGFNSFVTKPFNPINLFNTMKAILN